MIYLNDTVSLLKSEGHIEAHLYPIWKVWDEAKVVQRRMNQNLRTQATVMLMATATATGGKKAQPAFKKFLESFDGEE